MSEQPTRAETEYNYNRFEPSVLMKDAKLIRQPEGPHPGDVAPDFTLKDTAGKQWELHHLKGKPTVMVIGSGTCPITQGSLPGMKALHRDYSRNCHWLMLYVREGTRANGCRRTRPTNRSVSRPSISAKPPVRHEVEGGLRMEGRVPEECESERLLQQKGIMLRLLGREMVDSRRLKAELNCAQREQDCTLEGYLNVTADLF